MVDEGRGEDDNNNKLDQRQLQMMSTGTAGHQSAARRWPGHFGKSEWRHVNGSTRQSGLFRPDFSCVRRMRDFEETQTPGLSGMSGLIGQGGGRPRQEERTTRFVRFFVVLFGRRDDSL